MKATFVIAAFAALTAAQSIADLPPCSLSCLLSGVSATGCGSTDLACACKNADKLTPSVEPCVQKACPNTSDQEKVIGVISGICSSAGFPINAPAPAPSSAAPAPSSAAPAPSSAAPAPASEEPASSAAPTVQTSAPASSAVSGYAAPSSAAETCAEETVTVTVSSHAAPYPTAPVGTGVAPKPSGTGVVSAPPSYFTGAAAAVKVPAVAGFLGLAALVL